MNDKIHILLAEDEQTLAMIIKETLEEQGFDVSVAGNGEEALHAFFEQRPDVLVADVMMPRLDGYELVRLIRQTDRHTPILFLTARSNINDVVHGFELGANDYLKKPFGMQELMIRVKALLGRACISTAETGETDCFVIGTYRFHPRNQQLVHTYSLAATTLSHRESELLRRLCENRDAVVNTQSLLLDLWGDDSFFNTRSLHVFISRLRRHLSRDPHIRIINVRSIGYKLIVE